MKDFIKVWAPTWVRMTIIISFAFISNITRAETLKMLLWYPGGEGDATNAEPILQEFSNQIKNISQGKLDLKIDYSQEEVNHATYQKLKDYQFAIISHDAYLQKSLSQEKLTTLLSTLPLPSGQIFENYYLLKDSSQENKLFNSPDIIANRPYSSLFLKNYFPELASLGKYQFKYQKNIIGVLKNLSNNKNQIILLDSFQYESIKKLDMPWIKSLKIFTISKDVPSAKLLIIGNNPEIAQIMTDTLMKIQGSPVLLQLRLKGFSTQF